MKSLRVLCVVLVAVLLLTACGGGGSTEPAAQRGKETGREVDMEALVARYHSAVRLLKAAEDAADNGEPIDMEVLTSRRCQVLQAAEALRIAQAGEP